MSLKDKTNVGVAAISAFASNQFDCQDPYPFCSNPMEFIHSSNIASASIAGKESGLLQEVQRQITTFQTRITTFQTQITTFQAQITTVQTQIATFQTQITTFQTQIATFQTQITTFQTLCLPNLLAGGLLAGALPGLALAADKRAQHTRATQKNTTHARHTKKRHTLAAQRETHGCIHGRYHSSNRDGGAAANE